MWETQIFGWIAADPDRAYGRRLVVHPGTHAKWVVLEDERLVRFATFMTGEVVSVSSQHP